MANSELKLESFTIDDNMQLSDQVGIEVTVIFADGSRRWCFFMTPKALEAAGDWVEGTQVRHHLGELHMIVVSEISHEIISRILRTLDAQNDLVRRTIPR